MAETKESSYKQLNCPICLETFESPKVLACFHTFCEKCICRHVSSRRTEGARQDTILCPVCRSHTPAPSKEQTPDDWAAKLPTNAIIVSFLVTSPSSKDDPVYCQPCLTLTKQHSSVAYCVTCLEYLCNNCYTYHKIFKVSKDHTVTIQSMPLQQDLNSIQEDMYRCSIHCEQYKYLCSDHKELCCSDCAIKDHRKCDELLTIKESSTNTKESQDLKKLSDNLDELKKLFITFRENRSLNLESIEQQRNEITKAIKDWSVMIKQLLDRLETAALAELDQMCKQETVTISDDIIECNSAIAAIETSEKMLIDDTKSDDVTKNFITMTKVSQQVHKYREKCDTMKIKSEVVELEFHRDITCEEISKSLNSLGKMFRRARKISKISPDMSFSTSKKIQLKIQPSSMVHFSAKIPGDYKQCRIFSGVFLPDDRIVVSDMGNMKLKMLDKSFRCISSLKMDSAPKHVCRLDDSTVAVTLWANINLVFAGNTLTPLRNIPVGISCYGIASYQHNIIVDIIGDSLLTYDTSYKVISKIESYDDLSNEHNMHCVSQDGQNIFYTTKNVIVTMDMKGNKRNTFQSNDLKGASGITVDKNGIIYCYGSESKTIIQVTSEGRQLGVLLSNDDGLRNPLGICLNDRNDVILVFEGNSNLKVFKLI